MREKWMELLDWSAATNPPDFSLREPVETEPDPPAEFNHWLWAHGKCPSCGGIIHIEDGCPYCLTGNYDPKLNTN